MLDRPRLLQSRERKVLERKSELPKTLEHNVHWAMLRKGQKVRLNAKGRHFYESPKRSLRTRVIDWKHRAGTVAHITRDRKGASVLWEDNTTASEPLPLSFLEAIQASGSALAGNGQK
jgi:hypothetical protein